MVKAIRGLGALVAALCISCSGSVKKVNPPVSNSPNLETKIESLDLVHPKYKLNVTSENPEEINRILNVLENVHDSFQEIANNYKGTVVIFDGIITENESMRKWKGVQIPKWSEGKTYDILPGAYSVEHKEALIKQSYKAGSHGSVSLELHEYGHLIDHALGELINLHEISATSYFVSVHQASRTYKKPDGSQRLSNYGYKYRDEFFAESFAKFYFSPETKAELKGDFREDYHFLEILEMKAAEGLLADLNKLNNSGYEPHTIEDNKGDTINGKCVVY